MAPTWYLGPLGDLRALTCPEPGISTTLVRYGAVHQGLSGARTVDVTGHRAEYQFDWNTVTRDEWAWLEALHARHVPGPLRLVNPLKRNRLSTQSTSLIPSPHYGVGIETGYAAWSWSNGDYPGEAQPGYRALRFDAWSAGDRVLEFDIAKPTAVFAGETVTASIYLRGEQDDSVSLGFLGYDTPFSPVEVGEETEAAVTGEWQRFTVTHTVDETTVALVFTVTLPVYADAGVLLAAPQLETGESASDWEQGGGAPVVSVDQLETSSPEYTVTDCTLSLLEV